MLQMMTSEFIKSLEKNEYPLEYDLSARNTNNNNNNNLSNHFNNDRSTVTGFLVNNKEQMPIQDDGFQNLKKNSKMKLPKVKQYSKPRIKKHEDTLPISEDENVENYVENNNENMPKSNSPKILKITKKVKQRNDDKSNIKNLYGSLMTMQGGFTTKDKNYGFSRNNILKNERKDFHESLSSSPKNL